MSLRLRIILLVLAATLLPVIVMALLLIDQRANTVTDARNRLNAEAELIAKTLSIKIDGAAQLIYGLSYAPILDSGNKAACSHFLKQASNDNPLYSGILTTRPDGMLDCDSFLMPMPFSLADRSFFIAAMQAQDAIAEPAIGRRSGKAVIQVMRAIRDAEGRPRFAMLASIDMSAYGEVLAKRLPLDGMRLQLWNRDGSVVMNFPGHGLEPPSDADSYRSFVLDQAATGTLALGKNGDRTFVAKADLQSSRAAGMRVVLTAPEQALIAGIDAQFRKTMYLVAAIAVLIFLGGWALGEIAIRRQAVRLINAIGRLDSGVYDRPIGAPYPRGELGQVMRSLDRMGESLETQRRAIMVNTQALERQARIDGLTGLANRLMLTHRLDQALLYARQNLRTVAVLMLDLDRFKTVNDTLGHSAGDELLKETGRRLNEGLRQDDTVARLGGDEFVVVLADVDKPEHIVPIGDKLLQTLAEPMQLCGQAVSITASLGVAIYPRDGETAEALLRFADTAMYRAKDEGGNAITFFTETMMQAIQERVVLEHGLRRALEQHELRLHYQPIVDARSGHVTSAEALVRWIHPERGLILPGQFIPLAEETGLIVPIGMWVLEEACRQARRWRDQGVGHIPVAVNLSARQFRQPNLDELVALALRQSGCPPELLMLEITESSIMDNLEQAMGTMHRLTALGVGLMIDDFGTGYSSLSQLKRFPVSTLKIDASFVRDLLEDENDEAIVDTIITLAQKLGLLTVAEGVESREQMHFLATRGCDKYQGYYFSRPCEADAFAEFVLHRNQKRGVKLQRRI